MSEFELLKYQSILHFFNNICTFDKNRVFFHALFFRLGPQFDYSMVKNTGEFCNAKQHPRVEAALLR